MRAKSVVGWAFAPPGCFSSSVMLSLDILGLAVLFVVTLVAMWFMVKKRRARDERDSAELALAKKEGRAQPATLHPVIDPDKCMSSLSCLAVCPEGDILGVVEGKAALVNPAACIGHGKCALECPIDAISLVIGTEERGVDLPEVDEFFETSRPGVHIVGELGGMGLIKNAVTQGLQCADALGAKVRPQGGIHDVIIVGSGPAGIACALGLKKAGLSFRILDRETSLGGTIAQYPRQKVVMTERVELPIFGKFGDTLISKEELVESMTKAVQKGGLHIDLGVQVTGITGQDGAFTVATNKGPVSTRKVVLAAGRRGTPRKLGCKGDDLPKVTYRLIDASQYEGKRVVVVGGGDAALEAAIQLAEETDAEVVLSYRQAEFGKARDANKKRIKELADDGRVTLFLPSKPKEVTPDAVHLEVAEGRVMKLPNDYVIACLGGELPAEFLKACGVSMKKYTGQEIGAGKKAAKGGVKEQQLKNQKRLAFALFTLGCLITATLAVVGFDYYQLGKAARLAHPLHRLLKPSGTWGHGVGIVATLFMLSNFLYSVRKRVEAFKGAGPIRNWLTFHQFVGLMSPLAIAFHAAFMSNNLLATTTAAAVSIVVATGVVGRFIYGLVPSENGRAQELGEVVARWEKLKSRLAHLMSDVTDPVGLTLLLDAAGTTVHDMALPTLLVKMPLDAAKARREAKKVRGAFPDAAEYQDFEASYTRLRTLRYQVTFYKKLKRFMAAWRVFHVVLAVMLVFLIAAHIAVSLYFGYFWIFTK